MITAEVAAFRQQIAAQTAAARRKALEDAPPEISEHGRSVLVWLWTGSSPQQQPQDAA